MKRWTMRKLYTRLNLLLLIAAALLVLVVIMIFMNLSGGELQAIAAPLTDAAPTSTFTPSPSLNYHFGISLGGNFLSLSDSEMNARLQSIAALGVGSIRFDIQWDDIQPNDSQHYDWHDADRLVNAANAYHIKLLPILDYAPKWARSTNCTAQDPAACPPADPSAFGTFAQTVAARYTHAGMTDWEIWNEPNLKGTWFPSANASAYAAILKAANLAIKGVNASATIITGGLGPTKTSNGNISPVDFLSSLYANGAKPYFDAVGDHPYSYPVPPSYSRSWNAWTQMAQTNPSLRSIMTANGDAEKKLWITEYGAPTGGPGALANLNSYNISQNPDHVSEALQSAIVADAITSVEQSHWIQSFFWYSYQDIGTASDTIENFFGLLRHDGSAKPAYATLKTLLL